MELNFSWVDWTPEEIRNLVSKIVEKERAELEKIKIVPKEERSFDNTVLAMERADYETSPLTHYLEVLMNVSTKKEVRDAAKDALEEIQKEFIEIYFNDDIWRSIEEYGEKGEELIGPDKKLFEDLRIGFTRIGFGLTKEIRDRFKENLKKMVELESQFVKNINEYRDHIVVTKEELQGMEEGYIQGLRKTEDGKYIVGLEYPEYIPFTSHAKNSQKRKELVDKNFQKGGKENMDLLLKIISLRKENAELLGYKNHVAYETSILMSKNDENVFNFLNDLGEKVKTVGLKDLEELAKLKIEREGGGLEYSDVNYYIEELQKQKFNFDSEKLREYFPLKKVKYGIFEIYSKLLSVKFEKIEGEKLWHEDVEIYRMLDSSGELLAHFALDIFPRDGKYTHACAMPIHIGKSHEGSILPFATLLMNFRKPTGETPSLLSHDEVETFFHEFGHLVHFCLGKNKYASQNPFDVAHDFVEAPSQMLEYWVWNKESLRILSEHYLTKEPIPDEILDSLIASKDFMQAYLTARQVVFALFDHYMHKDVPRSTEEICALYNKTFKNFIGMDLPKENIFPAGFGHLMGYDAKYYSYTWSRVFAADMFTRFKNEGLLNEKTGGDYRKHVLEPGSSTDEIEMLKEFLGREPNNEAFLKEIGMPTE